MKAEELRIGNWVCHTPSKNKTASGNFIVSEISAFTIDKINGLESEDIDPIPLTEEWLVRFGFDKDGFDWFFMPKKDHVVQNGYSVNNKENVFEIDELIIPNIQHVHQLQNLYFALTGEELTLKTEQ